MGARTSSSTWVVPFDAPSVLRRLFGAADGGTEHATLVAAARALVAEAVHGVALPDGQRVEVRDGDPAGGGDAQADVVPVEVWSPGLLAWRNGELSRAAAVEGIRRHLVEHVTNHTKAA